MSSVTIARPALSDVVGWITLRDPAQTTGLDALRSKLECAAFTPASGVLDTGEVPDDLANDIASDMSARWDD